MAIKKEDLKVGAVYKKVGDDYTRTISRIIDHETYGKKIIYGSNGSGWNSLGELTHDSSISFELVKKASEDEYEVY